VHSAMSIEELRSKGYITPFRTLHATAEQKASRMIDERNDQASKLVRQNSLIHCMINVMSIERHAGSASADNGQTVPGPTQVVNSFRGITEIIPRR
jgi:hypothetical protein